MDDLLRFRTNFPGSRVYYDLFDDMMDEFRSKKIRFQPNTAQKGYHLSDLIELLSTTKTADSPRHYVGSKSLLLEHGRGFKASIAYLIQDVEKIEVGARDHSDLLYM